MQTPSKEPTIDPTYTFEKVWATLDRLSERSDKEARELREQTQRMSDQFRQELREMSAETDRQMRETKARIEEVSANLDKGAKQMREEIGGIGNSNGFMTEDIFLNTFNNKKEFAGYKFDIVEENTKRYVKSEKLINEYDIRMYNCNTVAIIEAKYRAKDSALEQVLKKAENFRKIFPQYESYKLILGIAGMSFENGVEEKAHELGIGVVKFVGDTAEFHTENIKEY
ncbi:MAG: hypothetical protein LBO69_05035 [Ignavibacteria bacterium]|jgi:hypothetical protein|nr:hypothetical protein [Ignavibacteria bacterium]